GAVRCKSDLHSWKSAYKCCVLCNWFIALGHWRICDLLHCKGFVAVPAYSCGSWNCDNSSGVLARLGCYESRAYRRKSGCIYQVIRQYQRKVTDRWLFLFGKEAMGMAAASLTALHVNKGKTVAQCL